MVIRDVMGRPVKASTVFAASLEAIKIQLIDTLHQYDEAVSEAEIRWVVTVPAIWPDDARTFMRNASKEVNVLDSNDFAQ